ncbi:ABC transporter permease [Alicyclobacillus mali]|uniref:ABC transporter permease n=1 Tax=Alicyclobacillus mali (ex Roth et al. 2021) TaxID=1123961 RepID=A0ABS0F224_9BACL|nr:ABC transporter permease [Alicyclobacillus mali (ex Roth et al. 2021)]MBF8377353.1 ABC transporter permease [Alicyclobacillus mali (ex Roth et al. 2021)]
MKAFWSVLSYSFAERFKSRVYLITTLCGLLCMAILAFAPSIYHKFYHQHQGTLIVINNTRDQEYSAENFRKFVSGSYQWRISTQSQFLADKNLVKNGKLDGLVVIQNSVNQVPAVHVYIGPQPLSITPEIRQFIQYVYTTRKIQSLHLSSDQREALTANVNLIATQVYTGSSGDNTKTFVPVMLMVLLLYMSILLYGSSISTSVAVEKSSRVMELLITSVKPVHLMFGKVIGVGLAGLLQFLVYIVFFVICYNLSPSPLWSLGGMPVDFSAIPLRVLVLYFVFFVLGYFFYATLYAALGSLVSRSEDVTQSMLPLTLLMIVAFLGAIYSEQSPTNQLITIGSFIPFFAPMFMFVRVSMTSVPPGEIILSLLIIVVSIGFFGWLSAKIYRMGVLLYGKNPSYRQVLIALRSKQR